MRIRREPALRTAAAATVSAGLTAAGLLWLWAESVDARASRRWHGRGALFRGSASACEPAPADDAAPAGTIAVVVLGYGNRGERANFINRFRVRAGIRSTEPRAENLLVLCGGTVHSTTSEAAIMQRCAREALGYTGAIALDEDSRSTWENITNAIPHLEHADTIKIVSNAPHAEMGRMILWHLRPDLAQRLAPGTEHRFGEAPLLKILGALRAVQSKRSGAWARSARLTPTPQPPRP